METAMALPNPDEMKLLELVVKHAVDSKYFDKIGGVAGAFSIAMYAREMGLPLMASLFGGIRPVLGKVEIAPQMMNAMILRAGHTVEVIEHNYDKCTIRGTRKDTGKSLDSSFTMEDAKKAKIIKQGGAWETYGRNMLYVRALANLARWHFADVLGMAYVEGELSHEEEVEREAKAAIRKTLPNAEILTDKVKSNEDIKNDFYARFGSLETEKGALGEFLNTRPDPYDSMRKALSSPEQFEKFIPEIPKMLQKEKDKKQAEKTKVEVLNAMKAQGIPDQMSLELEMADKLD